MNTTRFKHHKLKYSIGILGVIPLVAYLVSLLPWARIESKSLEVISAFQPEELYTEPHFFIGLVAISFGIIIYLGIRLAFDHIHTRKMIKVHKTLLKKQYNEIIRLKEELKASEAQLKVQDVAQQKFLSLISKDLKSPLLALKSFTYTMKTKEGNFSPRELTAYATSLEKSLNSLLDVLNNVSRWSMAQSPLSPSKIDNININKMIAYTLHLMRATADKKRIALLSNVKCKVEVMGDAHMIEFILRNLVSNAIKFSNEDSVVMVKMREEEETFTISVKDSGIGMDEETLTGLFNITEKVSAIDSKKESVAGFSLILCKEFSQKMGGNLVVQSKPNKGSLFTVNLPKNVHQPHWLLGQ